MHNKIAKEFAVRKHTDNKCNYIQQNCCDLEHYLEN